MSVSEWMTHGSRSTYVSGCRCQPCRDAHAAYMRHWKTERPGLSVDDHRHGTINGYSNYSCRCVRCVAVNADKSRARRQRTGK